MTFRKSNKNCNKYELICFCNKSNYNIYGASQKLFNYFISKCNPTCVISSIDRRFNNDDYLIDIGFRQFETIKPTFYYVVGMERKNKTAYNKKRLVEVYDCPKNVTEHQFCLSKKWYRIYDCGNVLYKWTNNEIQ